MNTDPEFEKDEEIKPLKLFVWVDVLSDYTSGIAFALAKDEKQARELLLDQQPILEEDYNFTHCEPKVWDTPKGYTLHGGG